MKKILFIINTILERETGMKISGVVESEIEREKYEPVFEYSGYPGHATEIAKTNLDQYQTMVAVGGDGTLNEIGRVLLQTSKVLGIIPIGSGNGLARSLKIPLKVAKAVRVINEGSIRTIDTGTMNDRIFIHMAGLGFAADVAKNYCQSGKHGLGVYARYFINTFIKYRATEYMVRVNGKEINKRYFLIDFANVSQWGYNAHICPKADPSDGKLNVCLLSGFPKILIPCLVTRLFAGTMHRSPFMQIHSMTEAEVIGPGETWGHIDGDPVLFHNNIQVKVLPSSLKVISGI